MEIIWGFAVAVAVVIGLIEVLKNIGLSTKWSPLASVIIGIGLSFLFPQETLQATILFGIIVGLSSCGLYSGTKATIQNKV